MRTACTLLFTFLYFSLPGFSQGDTLFLSTEHDGLTREYILYVPEAYDGSEAWPLVLNFHGYTNTAEMQMTISQMNPVADTAHFLVAYPQGEQIISTVPGIPPEGPGWNVSYPGDETLFISPANVNDVDFTSHLIDQIAASFNLDLGYVFATGWSNGGAMSHVLACELPDRIAAIASVAGLPVRARPCNASRQIPVLEIHGTLDPVNGYETGDPTGNLMPVPEFLEFWANVNGCMGEPMVTELPDLVAADGSTVELQVWPDCDTELRHYKVIGGGHNWPGGVNLFPFLGHFNEDISASSEIWSFFDRNPHPDPAVAQLVEKELMVGDSLRNYLLYVPAAYDGSEEWPLVVNYHQFGWSPEAHMALTQFNAVADTGRFLIAYPQGLTVLNPIALQNGPGWAVDGNESVNDDVLFTDLLIQDIAQTYSIDPGRVFATGWGMGAGMASTALCGLPERIAAVGSVSNYLTDIQQTTCGLNRPVSYLFIQGTDDPFIPFEPSPGHPVFTTGFYATPAYLKENNNCSGDSTLTEIPDINSADASTVTRIDYADCDAGTEIVAFRVNGGGHAWPGGGPVPEFYGPVNQDIHASSEIWNFFQRNPHPNPAPFPAKGTYQLMETVVDGLEREYLVYTPPGHDGSEEWPLVFVFHGFTAPIDLMIPLTQMELVADTADFLVVYPQGLEVEDLIFGGTGSGWLIPPSYGGTQDDIAFVSQMIDELSAHPDLAIDLNRVHASGWSNGGEFSYYLACELADRIASVASVANPLSDIYAEELCVPARKISTLLMLGTNDLFFPIDGEGPYTSFEETGAFWAANNGCDSVADSIDLEDIDPDDQSTVTLFTYENCNDDLEVLSYFIDNGGHNWPGGYLGPEFLSFLGPVNMDIHASVEIWNFFNRNPAPPPPFELIDAQHQNSLGALSDGDVLEQADLPLRISVRINPVEEADQMHIMLEGPALSIDRMESNAPFSLFGNRGESYNGRFLARGDYMLQAIPYSENQMLEPMSLSFSVTGPMPGLTGFTLIEAESDSEIGPLMEGAVLQPSGTLGFRADPADEMVASVRFQLEGPLAYEQMENSAPYSLFGNSGMDYFGMILPAGAYTLTATPYPRRNGFGQKGMSLVVNFSVGISELSLRDEAENAFVPGNWLAYPNPSRDRITVRIPDLEVSDRLSLELYDFTGRRLLTSAKLPPGRTEWTFDRRELGLPRGTYILRAKGGSKSLNPLRIVWME